MKISNALSRQRSLLAGSATIALAAVAMATPAHAVIPNENTDSEEIVDDEEIYQGVGGIFTNVPGSFGLGVCSGSLINPRAYLFAAHCVNGAAPEDYNGTDLRAAVSFNFNARQGLINWLFNNSGTDVAEQFYLVSQIQYDPRSLLDNIELSSPGAGGFFEADIAVATLDTPAVDIPTWALLFSTLPAPESINSVDGTGYRVDIVGYGNTGDAFAGQTGLDFRRRAAENILGAFASLDDRDDALFGPGAPFLPQNLYLVDFDSQAGPFFPDFNLLGDAAVPNEGITAQGDSGGPLILSERNNDITSEDLVIGVLSLGGNFFGNLGALGSFSGYQPLSLYWQYIAEVNPYRYVGTVGGDGNWEDENHWVTLLDPGYRIIDDNGNIVNGIPTTPEGGPDASDGAFGLVCVDGGLVSAPALGPDECYDVSNGEISPSGVPDAGEGGEVGTAGEGAPTGIITEGVVGNNRGWADLSDLGLEGGIDTDLAGSADFVLTEVEDVALEDGEAGETGLPAPTLANGLPGASGFVPDNIDPDLIDDGEGGVTIVNGRYFDVTLSNAGTTTLSSAREIDRLTVEGAAVLDIAAGDGEGGEGGALDVLIDVTQAGGMVNVDGSLTSAGDYSLWMGVLGGTGTVETPFLTNFMGGISPGTMGGIGTLTVDGNAILTSASTLLTDIGDGGASDLLAVTGAASIGGQVAVGNGITDIVNGNGAVYTVLTADGGVTGTFNAQTYSPILSQSFTYEENAVLMQINAASYQTVANSKSITQTSYAQLFDQNRGNAALSGLFGLDFQNGATIRNTFEGLNPVAETTVRTLTAQSYSHLQNFTGNRMKETDRRRNGGTIATLGSPIQTAAVSSRGVQPINGAALAFDDHSEETSVKEGAVSEDVAIYLAGGFVNGRGQSLLGSEPNTPFDGYFYAAGFEYFPDNNTVFGISGYHSELEADAPLGQAVESSIWGASLYASHETDGGVVIDGMFSFANLEVETQRTVNFLSGTQTLSTDSNDDGIAAAAGIGYKVEQGDESLTPGVEVRYARNSFDTIDETGGILALRINRETYTSFQGRAGADYELTKKNFQINIGADVVYEFEDSPTLFQAQFVAGTGPTAGFGLGSTDDTWGEVSVAGTFGEGPFTVGVGVDATIGRTSANAQVWRATAAYTF